MIKISKRRKNHKPQIKVWTQRHTNAINTLARFNIVTFDNFKKSTEVSSKLMSDNAILDMEELGYIKTYDIEYKNKIERIVKIGPKGIRHVRNMSSSTSNHIYNSSSDQHDLEHSNFVFEIFSIDEIQKYYKCEKELPSLGQDVSATDGAMIFDTGELIFVETVTQYYTKEQKNRHKEYAIRAGGKYIQNNVRVPKKFI